MNVKKFRKKPVIIEAVQHDGTLVQAQQIREWMRHGSYTWSNGAQCFLVVISSKEGTMTATNGDWIIKGTAGEFYPCKPEIFKDIYESMPIIDTTHGGEER